MLTVGLGGQLFQSVPLELGIFLPHLESRVLVLTDWRRVRCLLKGAWTSLFFKPYPWWPGQWLHHFWSSQSRFSDRRKPKKTPTPIEFQSAASPTQSNSMKAHHLALRVALAYYCDSPYKYKVCMSPPTPPPTPPLSPCISTELLLLLRAAAPVAEGKLVWWKERKARPAAKKKAFSESQLYSYSAQLPLLALLCPSSALLLCSSSLQWNESKLWIYLTVSGATCSYVYRHESPRRLDSFRASKWLIQTWTSSRKCVCTFFK